MSSTLAATATADAAPLVVPRLPGETRIERLGNGLTVCLLRNAQAPLVTTALWYRVGTRDEPLGQGGIAHFLEHMMFKGSARFAPGEIDRRTQALGGSNNAFTSHDVTAYYFSFAADRWREALAIDSDRMSGLLLDPAHVLSERQVIVEEIAMYEDEPWDALEVAVHAALYGGHAYGKPVLGTAAELATIGPAELRQFHRRFYRPDNAVLIVAGDLDEGALTDVDRAFGSLPAGADARLALSRPSVPSELVRLERRQGEVPRLLLALPAPAASEEDHAALRLLVALLSGGRASRLQRLLVDEGQLCLSVSSDLQDTVAAGCITLGAELLPGVAPERVEAVLLDELARCRDTEFAGEEIDRAKQILVADWVFGHERVHQQALTAGFALSLFDLDHPHRQLERLVVCDAARVREVAERYLDPRRGAVLGWSMPTE